MNNDDNDDDDDNAGALSLNHSVWNESATRQRTISHSSHSIVRVLQFYYRYAVSIREEGETGWGGGGGGFLKRRSLPGVEYRGEGVG